jgi:Bacterial Ig domain
MSWKFSCHSSSSSSASSSCAFYKGGRLLLSSITIITIALLVLLPSPSSLFSFYVNANDFVVFASPSSSVSQSETTTVPVPPPPQTISSQSSQSESQEEVGPSADNFNLSDGYIIEPFLSNLSMPTSIAVDSANGTLYVAESIKEYDNNNNNNSSIMLSTSSPSPASFLSQQAQIRIVKDAISGNNSIIVNQTHDSSGGVINIDNNTTFINNALNWPVIDMEVDDGSGLLYAFHDHTTISRINTTSGEREDIITTEEEPDAGSDKYEEQQQQDPLSLLINSSSQIALSGKEDYLDGRSANDEQGGGSYGSYNSTVLYIPCMNGDVDNDYGTYCILSLPIDRSGNNAMVDNISSINSSSFILENMTSRPVGIAILNSSSYVAAASSSSSIIPEQQGPYTLIGSQTPNSFGNNNDSELLIITSQPTRNTIFNNSNNYSADALSSLSTIYHATVFGSIPYQSSSSNNLQDTTNNNNNYSDSNNNHQQQPALLPSVDTLVDYPHGQLGQVAVVFVRPVSTSPTSANETNERSQASSTDEDFISSPSSPPFGLNETTAFMVDFGNSSASAASATPTLPRIMMLDVQSGSITQFLTLKHPDPNFTPIDIAFDYNNSALYVLSSGNNNQEEDTNNTTNNTNNNLLNTGGSRNNNISSGVIWKISYQGLGEGEATTSSNNSTSDLETPPPPPPDSLNETDSSSNSSDDDIDSDDTSATETSYDEEEDDIDDFEDDIDDIEDDDSSSTDNSNSSSSSDDDNDDNDGSSSSSPSSPPSSDSSPPPSTPQPVNVAPIAEDDAAITDQDTPVVIDVLANDMDTDNDNPLTIDSVDEESIQGGNVRIISSSSGGSNDDGGGGDDNNNGGGSNTNEKIEYTPAEGFFGNDEFTYTIIDRNGATDSSRVTVTVNEVILVPHPIIYWLENEGGITQDLLEKAAEGHDNNNDDDDVDEWSFNLGNFRVPVEFDVSDNENDTKGILEGGGEGNNNNNDDDNTNAYDQLAAQLLTSKLNIENGVSTCESIETTIEYADTVLRNALYDGPGSTENPISESRDYAFELIEILDRYNNEGCV